MSFRVIKPTKTNLMDLQHKLEFAIKGERFLKFKREQLTAEIKDYWEDYQKSKQHFLREYRKIMHKLNQTYKEMGKRDLILISEMSRIQYHPTIEVKYIRKLGLTIPELKTQIDLGTKLPAYGFDDSSHFLDESLNYLVRFFELLIEFATKEDFLIKFVLNFKKVNRRVNGLKNRIIPSLELDIKKIREKLEEIERENFVRLKKTKELIRKKGKLSE